MMDLADKLTIDSVEHSSEAIITAYNDQIPCRQRSCMEYVITLHGVRKSLDFLQARKLIFVYSIFEIRYEKIFPVMIRCRVATVWEY
jgi:hypothetical protein